jgi:hypothetical protein
VQHCSAVQCSAAIVTRNVKASQAKLADSVQQSRSRHGKAMQGRKLKQIVSAAHYLAVMSMWGNSLLIASSMAALSGTSAMALSSQDAAESVRAYELFMSCSGDG